MKNISLNQASRYLFPGGAMAGYLSWKFQMSATTDIVALVLIGLAFYPFYRATYWLLIRQLTSKWPGIPQLKFHESLVKGPVSYVDAYICASYVINKVPETDRSSLADINSGVHVLYMSSLLLFVASILGIFCLVESSQSEIIIFLVTGILTLGVGIATDHLIADRREDLLLRAHNVEYIKAIQFYKLNDEGNS